MGESKGDKVRIWTDVPLQVLTPHQAPLSLLHHPRKLLVELMMMSQRRSTIENEKALQIL
jgi:hypothetical protein